MRLLIRHRLQPRFHAQKWVLHCLIYIALMYMARTLNCMVLQAGLGRAHGSVVMLATAALFSKNVPIMHEPFFWA